MNRGKPHFGGNREEAKETERDGRSAGPGRAEYETFLGSTPAHGKPRTGASKTFLFKGPITFGFQKNWRGRVELDTTPARGGVKFSESVQ
jgi:hypothetical protein